MFLLSRPWLSVQHTHNKPQDMWRLYRKMPFVWDEVKYEGDSTQNWGSLSAPQMVHLLNFLIGPQVGTLPVCLMCPTSVNC